MTVYECIIIIETFGAKEYYIMIYNFRYNKKVRVFCAVFIFIGFFTLSWFYSLLPGVVTGWICAVMFASIFFYLPLTVLRYKVSVNTSADILFAGYMTYAAKYDTISISEIESIVERKNYFIIKTKIKILKVSKNIENIYILLDLIRGEKNERQGNGSLG